jgi:hypothetical protein
MPQRWLELIGVHEVLRRSRRKLSQWASASHQTELIVIGCRLKEASDLDQVNNRLGGTSYRAAIAPAGPDGGVAAIGPRRALLLQMCDEHAQTSPRIWTLCTQHVSSPNFEPGDTLDDGSQDLTAL